MTIHFFLEAIGILTVLSRLWDACLWFRDHAL